ncbi:MAG TPA: DUF2069 domain-containing protein [Steroidobacteraceae bacterium]|nr:DUF2069 domain-containing protein [Steroidobacteraceae bacterium]
MTRTAVDSAGPAVGPGPLAIARGVVLAFVLVLCAAFVYWHVRRFSAAAALLVIALGVSPWLLAVRGLWDGNRRVYVGALLLTTPYLGYALMDVVANPGARVYAAITLFAAFALAVALVAFIRISRRTAAAPS